MILLDLTWLEALVQRFNKVETPEQINDACIINLLKHLVWFLM